MAGQGRVVILNGAPRSGKTSLARAVQESVPGRWINWGVDTFNATLPPDLLPGIGLRPGGERPDLEPAVFRLFDAYFSALASMAHSGFDVVADLGLHRDYAEPFDPLHSLRWHLSGLQVRMVGVQCDIGAIMARRNADPQGGLYLGGPDVPAPVARWQTAVHAGWSYDLVLDTTAATPQAGAAAIAALLAAGSQPPRP